MNNDKVIKSVMLSLVLMIVAVVGGTFAYWQWITSDEQQTLVNVSLTDDATIYIDFPSETLTNMYPTSDCDPLGTSSWVTDITVNNGTGVKLATNFKLKVKIEDKDGNVITDGTNQWNAKPFMYYIKYAVTEENETCQNALITGRFDGATKTYVNLTDTSDPNYVEKEYWYDSKSITKDGSDGFPLVSSRIGSGVSFHALPNRETSHRYKVWVWLDKDYTSVTVGNDSTMDKMQDAKVTVSWSENSELEQIRESATPVGEAMAIYSADDDSLRFYRETNPSSVTEGSTYNGRKVTNVYTGFEDAIPQTYSNPVWIDQAYNFKKIIFEDYIYPVSTAYWFKDFNVDLMDVTKLDTSNVTDMSYMFSYNHIENLIGVENWNTSNVTNMNYWFEMGFVGNEIDLSDWNVCNVSNYVDFSMGANLGKLPYFGTNAWCNGGDPAPNYVPNPLGEAIAIYSYTDNSLRFYRETTPIALGSEYNNLNVTAIYMGFEDDSAYSYNTAPWSPSVLGMDTIVFEDYIYPLNTAHWFVGGPSSINLIDVTKLDTSNVTNMEGMFSDLQITNLVGIENWDTSNVTNMENMFSATSISNSIDLGGWNVCNVVSYDVFDADSGLNTRPYFNNLTKCNGGNPA